jgi:hypothetical protein
MKRMHRVAAVTMGVCLVATTLITGCGKSESASNKATKQTKEAEDPMAGVFGNWDPAAELAAIQGTYKVKDFSGGKSEWTVTNNNVTIVRGDKTINSVLEFNVPGVLKVVTTKESGAMEWSNLSYARNDKDIYIGLGTAGSKVDNLYIVEKDGMIIFDGTACKYYQANSFGGGYQEPISVPGSIEADLFSFQIPDRFKPEKMKDISVKIVGNALVNGQAKRNLVVM